MDGSDDFPTPESIVVGGQDVPYYVIADDTFALRTWLMKPYSARGITREQGIINNRLSMAQREVQMFLA
jgi:hypothetical protein